MGNLSSLILQSKTINKQAFNYYKTTSIEDINGIIEILTDDFSKVEEIKKKILINPKLHILNYSVGGRQGQVKSTAAVDDIIAALTDYLNTFKPHNKIILSQTDVFIFKNRHCLPVLCIKNTNAEENRKKLVVNNNNKTAYYVASCDLSQLWTK